MLSRRGLLGASVLTFVALALVALAFMAPLRHAPAALATDAAVNVFGDLSNGICHTNPNSKVQCPAGQGVQFPNCEQAYAWPYYYYDKLIWMIDWTKRTDDPAQMQAEAMGMAQQACDSPQPYNGEASITLPQIAQVFLDVAGAEHAADCAAALVIAAGECQWSTGGPWGATSCATTGEYSGCATAAACTAIVKNGIWQNGINLDWTPQQSAAALYNASADTSIPFLCTSAPKDVPEGYISAGNTNLIGSFCHVNRFSNSSVGAFAWGGGQCAGGLGSNPPTHSCQCPAA